MCKEFVNKVPLVTENGVIRPEIRLTKDTVLILEYPINIYSPSKGLTHQGEGGHFTYRFKKDRIEYRIIFIKDNIILEQMDKKYSTCYRWVYSYEEIWLFIRKCNVDKTVLY